MGTEPDAEVSVENPSLDGINRTIGIFVLALGIALLAGGALWMHHLHIDLFLTGAKAQAQVTDIVRTGNFSRKGNAIYCMAVQFNDGQGQNITVPDAECSGNLAFRKGRPAAIFYDSDEPHLIMIDRGSKNLIIPGIILMFGGLTVLGGLSRINNPGVWRQG